MNILIVGSGFISERLIKKFLLSRDNKVYLLYRKSKNKINNKNLKKIKVDLFSLHNCRQAINKIKIIFDLSIFCANETLGNDEEIYKKNIIMCDNFISVFNKNIKKLIYLSSVAVYGDIKMKLITEKTKFGIQNHYGESKMECEKILKKNTTKNNIKIICLRLCGVVGEGVEEIFVKRIISKIKNNQKIKINNLNKRFNNIIYVDDLCEFIKEDIIFKNRFTIINLASSNPKKLYEIFEMVFSFFNYRKTPKIIGDSNSFEIDITKAKKYGYIPRTTMGSFLKYINEIDS